jgi:hypothetical protein
MRGAVGALNPAALDSTVRAASAFAEPPGPVQVIEYMVVLGGEMGIDPEIALPVEKPEPEQEAAMVDDHEGAADPPGGDRGGIDREINYGMVLEATITAVCAEAEPPGPVQVSV